MQTILIPSDFSKDSIVVAHKLVDLLEEDVFLLFAHAFSMPNSDQDLLYSNYRKKDRKYISREFMRGVEVFKDSLSYKVKKVVVDFFYGNTPMLFENYLDYYNVALIAYSSQKGCEKLSENSIDLDSIIGQSTCKSVDIDSPESVSRMISPLVRP